MIDRLTHGRHPGLRQLRVLVCVLLSLSLPTSALAGALMPTHCAHGGMMAAPAHIGHATTAVAGHRHPAPTGSCDCAFKCACAQTCASACAGMMSPTVDLSLAGPCLRTSLLPVAAAGALSDAHSRAPLRPPSSSTAGTA